MNGWGPGEVVACAAFGLTVIGLLFRGVWLAADANSKLEQVEQTVSGLASSFKDEKANTKDEHRTIWRHLEQHRERIEEHDVKLENHGQRIHSLET